MLCSHMVTQVVSRGRMLELGAATTLPAVLENSHLSLSFVAHDLHGVTLDTMTDMDVGTPFVWTNAQTCDDGSVTGRLWEMFLVGPEKDRSPWSSGFSSGFGGPAPNQRIQPPPDVDVFTTVDQDGRPALAFRWQEVLIPAPSRPFTSGFSSGFGSSDGGTNLCDVYAFVSLGDDDTFARWNLYCHRHEDLTVTMETITFPMLAFVGPVAARSGESHLVSQKRARVHMPEAQLPVLFGSNTSLYIWVASALEMDHPCGSAFARHVLSYGCCTLWAGDTDDAASYGRMMHFACEDLYGYTKTFAHRGELDGLTLLSVLSQTYWPQWAEPPFGIVDSTQFGCDFRSPYSVLVGVDMAKSADWTFDAADWYRRTVVKFRGLGGDRRKHDRRRSTLLQPEGQWLGCIRLSAEEESLEPDPQSMFERFHTAGSDILTMLGADYTAGFWQWQNVLLPVARFGNSTGILNPDPPVTASVDPRVVPVIEAIHGLGGHVAPYTEGLSMMKDSGWVSEADAAAEVCDRFGHPFAEPNEFRIDYGSPAGQELQAEGMIRDLVAAFGWHGFYCDGISGGGGRIAHTPSGLEPQHVPHGGKHHSQGKRKLLKNIRAELDDPERFLISEAHEEYVHQELDLTQDKQALASMTHLGEDAVLAAGLGGFTLGIDDVSPQSRDMNPPAFATVYGQYACNGTIAGTLHTRARFDHPTNAGVGLTIEQWNELLIWNLCTIAVNGLKVLWNIQDDFFADRITLADQPTQPITQFLPKLWALLTVQARSHLLGEMGRQFDVEYGTGPKGGFSFGFSSGFETQGFGVDTSEVDKSLSPVSRLASIPNVGCYPPFLSAASVYCAAYEIEAVLHRTFYDPETDTLILLLMNWTGTPASWKGTFRPWRHSGFRASAGFSSGFSSGFQAPEEFSVDDILEDGSVIQIVASASGALVVHANGSPSQSGSDLYIGAIPAYGIRVLRFSA